MAIIVAQPNQQRCHLRPNSNVRRHFLQSGSMGGMKAESDAWSDFAARVQRVNVDPSIARAPKFEELGSRGGHASLGASSTPREGSGAAQWVE